MAKLNIKPSTIYCHDNLEILQGINSNCIDLIYLDPPFNKNKTFTAPIGSASEGASFRDIFREEDVKTEWLRSIMQDHPALYSLLAGIKDYSTSYNYCYCVYMAIRLIECNRILKDSGSLYLHCDPTMSHYLKLVMDVVFGERNFRNEIVWHYYNKYSAGSRIFGRNYDQILFYSKTSRHTFTPLREERDKPVRQLVRENVAGVLKNKRDADGKLMYRQSTDKKVDAVWSIPCIQPAARQYLGYPTQKPLALLERIIKASSKPGDLVLDPFCGCATACIAAERLDRRWVGVDVSHKAYELVNMRMKRELPNHDLFKPEASFTTIPPNRSGKDGNGVLRKFVYVISNPRYPGEFKVGVAADVKKRLSSYQTSDPDRAFKIEFQFKTKYFDEIETFIHHAFQNKHEWVQGDLNEIVKAIKAWVPGKGIGNP